MRRILGESLRHIAEQISGVLEFDGDALGRLAEGLCEGRRFPPSTFALYAELVIAIQGEEYSSAIELLARLANERPVAEEPWQVLAFGDPGESDRDRLFQRFLDTDPDTRFGVVRPDPESAADFRKRLASAMELMARAIPALADEFNRLINQVIMVAADPGDKYQFDGGSSYMLWGGLFLNTASHENEIAMVEVLAHESAHMLLFGFASDEPLVLNGDDELYPSPLRLDPRPMDGIYHATFVSARMHWAMTRLLESGLLEGEGAEFAEHARNDDRKNFYDGYRVIEQSARLTETGRQAMQSAKQYMDTAL